VIQCLVKHHQNRGRQEIDRLGCGGRHLLALAATRGGLGVGLLAVMLPETRIHIRLNGGGVGQDVGQNTLLNRPTEEVELAHGGLLDRRGAGDDKTDPVATAERVEQFLAVGLEFTLVLEVDDELTVLQQIRDVEFLRIVRHEPLHDAETDRGGTVQEGEDRLNAPRLVVELLEPADDVVLFALNAVLEGVTSGLHPC